MPAGTLLRRTPPAPTGYPTANLVGYFDLMQDNLLLYPQEFNQTAWTKTRSYIAANCAADPDSGQYTVDKLVEDGTATNTHFVYQAPSVVGTTQTVAVRAKAGGRDWLILSPDHSGFNGISFNLATGVKGTTHGSFTGGITAVPEQAGWYDCYVTGVTGSLIGIRLGSADNTTTYSGAGHQGTAAAGGTTGTAVLAAGASAVDDVYNGTDMLVFSDAPTVWHTVTGYVGATKTATFTPARAFAPDGTTYTVGPGIYIARAQLNPGTSARPYQVNTDLQTLSSLYGKSPTLQRGTTSGAEASDPTFGEGAVFVTDDLMVSGNLSGVTMGDAFTLYIAGKFNGTSGTILSLAGSAADTDYQRIVYSGGNVLASSKAGAAAATYSAGLAVSTTANTVLEFKSDGTTLTLTNLTTGTAVTLAAQEATGACRLGVCVAALLTYISIPDATTVFLVSCHGSMLPTSGRTRALRAMRARAAAKGVVIS